jgi:DNA polymerase III alpha subunit (gram-positive type)
MKLINYILLATLASQPLMHADDNLLTLMSNVVQPIHSFVSKWGTQIAIGGLIGWCCHLNNKISTKDSEIADLKRHTLYKQDLNQIKKETVEEAKSSIRDHLLSNYVKWIDFTMKMQIFATKDMVTQSNLEYQQQCNALTKENRQINESLSYLENRSNAHQNDVSKLHHKIDAIETKHDTMQKDLKAEIQKSFARELQKIKQEARESITKELQEQLLQHDLPALHMKMDTFFHITGLTRLGHIDERIIDVVMDNRKKLNDLAHNKWSKQQ